MSEQQQAIHMFDDDNGLDIDQRKATLEAKHKELQVHVPSTLNIVSDFTAGTKLNRAGHFHIQDQQ